MQNSLNGKLDLIENDTQPPSIDEDLDHMSPIKKKYTLISPLYYNRESLAFEPRKKPPTAEHSNNSLSCTNSKSQSFIFEELGALQTQIKEINSKLALNIDILRKKQEKTKELKNIIKKIEEKTLPTDVSLEENSKKWSCAKSCKLF